MGRAAINFSRVFHKALVPYVRLELGRALCEIGRYEEALDPHSRTIAERPYWLTARALLIVAAVGFDAGEMASRHAGEILKNSPNFTVKSWGRTLPYKSSAHRERYPKPLFCVPVSPT